MRKGLTFLILICFVYINILTAGSGENSLEFLKIPVGARPAAMGYAFSSQVDDVNCLFWNPAGLGIIKFSEFVFSHNDYIEDIKFHSMGYVKKIDDDFGNIGLSLNIFDAGEFKHTLITGGVSHTNLGNVDAKDMAVGLSYGKNIREYNLTFGGTIKYIKSELYNANANAYSIDLGVIYKFKFREDILNLGFVISNIGTKIKYDLQEEELPLLIKIGLNSNSVFMHDNILMNVNIESIYEKNNTVDFALGIECSFSNVFLLRTGYNTIQDIDSGLSFGAGFIFNKCSLDYAWTPFDNLGNSHRISVQYKF